MKEAEKKKKLWPIALVAFACAYILLAVRPLAVERGFEPRWIVRADESATSPADGGLVAFRLADRFGFVSAEDGALALSRVSLQRLALGDAEGFAAWAEYQDGPGQASFFSPGGAQLFTLKGAEAPFFLEGRLYSLSGDDGGVSSWNADGSKAWSRDLAAPLTCVAAGRDLTALGCLNGALELVGPAGEPLFSFVPGGSRVPVVLGAAVSPDGRSVAVASGIGPQRFLLFELRKGGYKLKRHFDLESDFRRRVAIAFSTDGRLVFLEQEGSLLVIPVSGEGRASLELPGDILSIHPGSQAGIHAVHCRDGLGSRIIAFSSQGRFVMAADLDQGSSLISRRGDGLYLGTGERVARLDMVEEGK